MPGAVVVHSRTDGRRSIERGNDPVDVSMESGNRLDSTCSVMRRLSVTSTIAATVR